MTNNLDKIINDYNGAFYLFDINILKSRIEYLKTHLPENVTLCYAVKANSFITKEIENDVNRFEICSPGEAEICRNLHISSEKMVISGVYKSFSLIDFLMSDKDFSGIFTVESLSQFEMIKDISEKKNVKCSVLLRLTNDSQFGINENDIINIIKIVNKSSKNINICGIQFFSGTQKQSIKKLKREIEHLDEFIIKIQTECGFIIKELEYGPGFPVTYFESDVFEEDEFLNEFSNLVKNIKSDVNITLEIGRSIVASCGKYYTKIVDLKENKNQKYILVDGGMHQLVYFGQHMAMKQPFLSVYKKEKEVSTDKWNICGSLCSMNDILAKQVELPDINIGDILCFENTGAYCVTEGISLFLSRELPAVYLINEKNQIILLRDHIQTSYLNTPKYERKNNNGKIN